MRSTMLVLAAAILFAGCGVSGGGSDSSSTGSENGGSNSDGTNSGGGDTTAPTVVATAPCDCGSNIVTDATISAIFSEAMDSSSINSDTFTINDGLQNIVGSISYSGTVATFKPASGLSPNTVYTVTLSTVKDSSGNTMTAAKQWEFHAGAVTSTPGARFTDVQGIFNSKCISCHVTGGTTSFLPLTEDVSYENIVGQQSIYTVGPLISSGNSLDSILYKRVSGSTVGDQMPKGLPALSQGEQDSIKTWIDEGALNN